MRYRLSRLALIATAALLWTGCASTRTLRHDAQLRVESVEWRDSVVVECVEVHDTLREVTTITVDRNDRGDTLKVVQITDRDRLRDRSQLRDKSEKLIVKTDTVYIEKRDSILVKSEELRVKSSLNPRPSTLILTLKWIFAVICAVGVLIIVVKLKVEN